MAGPDVAENVGCRHDDRRDARKSLNEAPIIRRMRIALVQQHATHDKAANVARGLRAFETAARAGCFFAIAGPSCTARG
jgi:hypothetical protein